MKYYRIWDPTLNQFSEGGSVPKFTKAGKFWTKRALTQHLLFLERVAKIYPGRYAPYDNCKILEYDLIEKGDLTISDFLEQSRASSNG